MTESCLDLLESGPQFRNVGFERREPLIELTVGKPDQGFNLANLLPQLRAHGQEFSRGFLAVRGDGFRDQPYLLSKLFRHDSEVTLDLIDGFAIHCLREILSHGAGGTPR